jgi:ABC-type transport system substrate-binding protein
MKTRFVAVVLALAMAMSLLMAVPAHAVKGQVMDNLQFNFYGTATALYTGLVKNEIDFMGWPLTYTQYIDATYNPDVIVAPYYDLGDYELAINNNYSLPDMPWRSPTNYTEFRQAIACLVDKDGLIAGPALNGFATRIDTHIPRPALNDWVNYNVSKYGPNGELLNNYPWDYNPAKAAQILDAAGFIQGSTPNPDYDPSLPWSAKYIRVYPPGHEKAGQDLDPLIVYIRRDHAPRKALGEQVANDLKKIGIPVTIIEGGSRVCHDLVYKYRKYHLYTAGWSLGRFPIWFYSFYNPIGIYPGGPNFYQINDHEVTPWTEEVYPKAQSVEQSMRAAKMCQYYQVMKAYCIPVWSSASYYAYRKGFVYVPATQGYGLTTGLDFVFLATYHQNYPTVNTIRYGTMNPPVALNPLFSSWLWDYEVLDRIFTGYMNGNPYKMTPGKSPAGGDLPWMAYDWKWEIDPTDGNATVTLWFRHDIKWHDGVPFTVDDLNETIELGKYYDDSWGYSDFVHVIGFTKIDDYTCKIHFDMQSIWALYTANYDIVPKHIYGFNSGKHHPLPTDPDFYDVGPHGYWPWKDDTVTPVSDPAQVWVGTSMWKYVPGTHVPDVGGGILLTYNPDFWMQVTAGEIDFAYYWTSFANVKYAKSYNANKAIYTDETEDINNPIENDVTLPPIQNQTSGDCIYIGDSTIFTRIIITVTRPGNYSGIDVKWEYWNGNSWFPIANLTDETKGFTKGGSSIVIFTPPSNWVETKVDGVSAYWIRARAILSTNTSIITAPLASIASVGYFDCFKIGLPDLVLLANAYGTRGDGEVPFKVPGTKGAWNPGADLASPSGIIGLSDLVTLAKNYGKTWGRYPP